MVMFRLSNACETEAMGYQDIAFKFILHNIFKHIISISKFKSLTKNNIKTGYLFQKSFSPQVQRAAAVGHVSL